MAKHKIGVIADTHSLLRPEILEILSECEVILHAGDIASPKVVSELKQLKETFFVRGNADKDWADELPPETDIDLFGFHIYMVHNKKDIRKDLSNADIVIYGHSHKYEVKQEDNILYLNPGSCGPRRFHQPVTMALMLLDDTAHSIRVNCMDVSPVLGKDTEVLPPADMDRVIRAIVKGMETGRSLEDIAARTRVDRELVRRVLQIYTTHPGIDVDGILNRL